MNVLDTWGVTWEVENIAPELKAETVAKRPTQIIQKSNNIIFPLFHLEKMIERHSIDYLDTAYFNFS